MAGPFTSVLGALVNENTYFLKLPLSNYHDPVKYLDQSFLLPTWLGSNSFIKYLVDFLIEILLIIKIRITLKGTLTAIAIDPLCAMPATILRRLLDYKLIFYSVDFNETRFKNKLMQRLYELFDKFSATHSEKTWVVCDSLKVYKKETYGIDSVYMPNSFPYDGSYFLENKGKRTGNKAVWKGIILVDSQIRGLVRIAKELQQIRPELEFLFLTQNKKEEFETEVLNQSLERCEIVQVLGQKESWSLVAQCDIGLAIYDNKFGSTKYIEPIKIWGYAMCGIPFIISCEPSLNDEFTEKQVCLKLLPNNQMPDISIVRTFISQDALLSKQKPSLELAQKYDLSIIVKKALEDLN